MANSLYNPMQNNPYANIIKRAQELKQTLESDPKAMVQQLLNSGRMSQQQFNALSQQAQQIIQFIK